MTDELKPTAGTPAGDDGDKAQASTGTPAADDRNASETPEQELARLREERNLYLAWKQKAEDANRLAEENERLKREAEARPSGYTPPTTDPRLAQQQQDYLELQQAIQQAELAASQGDYLAKLTLAGLRQQAAVQQQSLMWQQLMSVPEDKREAVQRELATGRYADAQAAYDAIDGRELRKSREEYEKRRRELEAEAAKRASGVVGSGRGIPIPASQMAAGGITYSEFNAEYDRLMAEDPAKARAYARPFALGEKTRVPG